MERFFRWSLTCLLLLATGMECIQVALRYWLEMPVIMPVMWLDETIIFPAIWIYMLGCANASRENSQIVAKILPALFPFPRPVAVFDCLAQIFSLIISCWLTWYAVEYFFYSITVSRKTGYLFWPLSIGETAVSAGMVLITFYTCVQLLKSIRTLRKTFAREDYHAG